jgi:hypothetical protein
MLCNYPNWIESVFTDNVFSFSFSFFETKGQHANDKAHEAVDHPASFPLDREEISQPHLQCLDTMVRSKLS